MDNRHPFHFLQVQGKHRDPPTLERSIWASHPVARWFQAELEHRMLEALFRLEHATPDSAADIGRAQGVIQGIRIALDVISTTRKTRDTEE